LKSQALVLVMHVLGIWIWESFNFNNEVTYVRTRNRKRNTR